jgi:hypothetical protein
MERKTSVQIKRDKNSVSDIEDEVWVDCSADTDLKLKTPSEETMCDMRDAKLAVPVLLKKYMKTYIHQEQLTGKIVPQLTQALKQEMTM